MTATTEAKPVSLVRKLANVMGAVDRVAKNGVNPHFKYAYATESDITAAVRGAMSSEGVVMIPTVESIDWDTIETRNGAKERFCTAHMLFTLLDADSDSKIEVRNIGQGQDGGDKAFYKAVTGATKYALLKLFLIPTGDDPEADSPEGVVVDAAVAATKAKELADRAVGIQKMVTAFATVGVDAASLDKLAGGPVASISNDTWARLRKEFEVIKKAHDAAPPSRPAVEDLEQERALAEYERLRASNDAAVKVPSITFANCIDRIRAAKTEEECVIIESEFVGMRPAPTSGDLKAMARAATDRRRVLADAKAEAKKPKLRVEEDVPL